MLAAGGLLAVVFFGHIGPRWLPLAAVVGLVIIEVARLWMYSGLSTTRVGSIVPGATGLIAALGLTNVILPQVVVPVLAASLGVSAKTLHFLPTIATSGFLIGLVAQLLVRRTEYVPTLRVVLLGWNAVSLVGVVAAPTPMLLQAATFASGVAGSMGMLLPCEAAAARRALNPWGGMNALDSAMFSTLGLVLLSPSLPGLLSGLDLHVGSPAKAVIGGEAALSFAAMRLLPALLERVPELWGTATRKKLWNPHLLRAILLTTLAAMSITPIQSQITFILSGHGVRTPSVWAAAAMLSVIAPALWARPWHRLMKRHLALAEFICLAVGVVGSVVGLITSFLSGLPWAIGFGFAVVVTDVAASQGWTCAQFEALKDPADIRRAAFLGALRWGWEVPVGAVAALGWSEVERIWIPSLGLVVAGLVLQVAWLGPSGARLRLPRNSRSA